MTPKQVANQLLQNGKPASKERCHQKKLKSEMDQALQDSDEGFEAFTTEEIDEALNHLKLGKAAGIDGIFTKMIKNFGPTIKSWVLSLLNKCAQTFNIPKTWRKSRVVALLKPGKDPTSKMSYRPISYCASCTSYMNA